MMLNVEEMIFLAGLNTDTKEMAVQEILRYLPYITDRDIEETAEHALLKLDAISDQEFSALDFDSYREG